jgi:NADPH-dependent ferric siderophore reductase
MSSHDDPGGDAMHGTVVRTRWLTPSMVRVVLGGDGLADYEHVAATDAYVNVAIAPTDAPYEAPFDIDRIRREQPDHLQPVRRRYTVRRFSAERRELTIDVVVHDGGPGGRWAAGAGPGDVLTFTGPGGGFRPEPGADHHVFAGDASALPAIAASLEALPPTATGTPAASRWSAAATGSKSVSPRKPTSRVSDASLASPGSTETGYRAVGLIVPPWVGTSALRSV